MVFLGLLPSEVELADYVTIHDGVVVAGHLNDDEIIRAALGETDKASDEDLCDELRPSARTTVPVSIKKEPAEHDDNLQEENSNGSVGSGSGGGGLGRLPLSSVPPRKRRAALAAAAALPRKSKRQASVASARSRSSSSSTTAFTASSSSAMNSNSSRDVEDMAEGAAHALLNLAKVATSQQQLMLQSKNSLVGGVRERR
ncbi:hypothetical protein HPB52_018716 [Rhipicephalus sanguineus]|uniref:Uncharacterized protein n=1 Tax=Rhipicephalus sanguineus TaxID=34632 RepID=A0A9D4T4S1_RHISA|nr:hypothetical protein HPB52_018716 [Rhipicephalus sanguineus]